MDPRPKPPRRWKTGPDDFAYEIEIGITAPTLDDKAVAAGNAVADACAPPALPQHGMVSLTPGGRGRSHSPSLAPMRAAPEGQSVNESGRSRKMRAACSRRWPDATETRNRPGC